MRSKFKRNFKSFLWWFIISLFLICFIIFTETNVRPVMLEVAINDAQAINEKIINNAVYDALEREKVDFSSLIMLKYDENKSVKSVAIDSVYLSKLKLIILKNISNGFKDLDIDSISIRLGSFIDNEFTYGRGPNIKFNYEMTNTVDCAYKSNFVSTGINQSKHNFAIEFTTDVEIITPLFSTSTTFNSEVLLNEMIIVGEVPKNHTNIAIK